MINKIFKNTAILISLLLFPLCAFESSDGIVSIEASYSKGAMAVGSVLTVKAVIEDGWHITSNQPEDEYMIPAEVSVSASNIKFGTPRFPEPVITVDTNVDITTSLFGGVVQVVLDVKKVENGYSSKDSLATAVSFTFQPCNDKMCLPPFTKTVVIGGDEYKQSSDLEKAESNVQEVETPIESGFNIRDLIVKLLFALLGGLILNLMPCVLPVLSLKVFSLVKQSGESRGKLLRIALSFTGGIFVSFMALAIAVVIIRHAGSMVGWGFQFQNPLFIIVMAGVMVVFAMNMFGLFEIFLPNAAHSKLHLMSGKSGYGGAFFNGILMTLLSTPCSAPFLGTAMGYAFSQPVPVLFLMFAAVAIGLALPYFILSLFPSALRWVPKPGDWMLRLKEFMGFLLLLTVIWLLSVLGEARGVSLASWTAVFLLIISCEVWMLKNLLPHGGLNASKSRKIVVWISLIFVAAVAFQVMVAPHVGGTVKTAEIKKGRFVYSEEKIEELLSQGRTVFLDFTAAWCVTCKSNEKLVLESDDVEAVFAELNVAFMIADWTNGDEAITKKLQSFNRAGVPVYAVYHPGKPPVILPEIITRQMVIDAVKDIDKL
jgi:thiol:disulfide interchange protein